MPSVRIRPSWVGAVVVGMLVAAWLFWITFSIAHEPVPGESSLGELSAHTQEALTARDAGALGLLLDYPQKDAPDFAQQYLDGLGPDTDTVTVAPDEARSALTVSGHRRAGTSFTYTLKATRNPDGRWLVSFLPPV